MSVVITVDGPSGVGKGTLSSAIAETLGYHFLDSGAIYRVLGFASQYESVNVNDTERLIEMAKSLPLRFEQGKVFYKDMDVSDLIRNENVAALASQVASIPEVRSALLERQQNFAQAPGLVADGRDMGTVVFPEAELKLFLTASAEVRAQRRVKQLKSQGKAANIREIISDIQARDARDANRSTAPLKPADDAIIVDTSDLTIEEVLKKSMDMVKDRQLC